MPRISQCWNTADLASYTVSRVEIFVRADYQKGDLGCPVTRGDTHWDVLGLSLPSVLLHLPVFPVGALQSSVVAGFLQQGAGEIFSWSLKPLRHSLLGSWQGCV